MNESRERITRDTDRDEWRRLIRRVADHHFWWDRERRRPLSLDRVGSSSRKLSELPLTVTPTARYERRPCLYRIRCTCRSSDFLLFVQNGFVVGLRSLKVTVRHLNNASCCYEYPIVSVPRIARHYTILSAARQTHTRTLCTLSWTTGGRRAAREGGSERARGGREEAMIARQGESVSGGREGWWRERATKRGMEGAREEASGGGIEWGMKGAREGNFKGGILSRALASIQYIHKPSHNAALALETLVLKIKNSEQV